MNKHIGYRTGNPALSAKSFDAVSDEISKEKMTLEGAVNKSILSLGLLVSAAIYTFNGGVERLSNFTNMLMPLLIIGLIIGFITIFKKNWSPITAPIYAIVQGLLLGVISQIFERMYDGIVFQAIYLTFGIFFTLLFLYKSKIIKPTENFKLGVVAATGGIFLLYFVNFIMNFFGSSMPVLDPTNSSLMSIGISFFIVIIASANLVLDFDFIEEGAEKGAPKYMEWYSAFGLTVTLVWLYLEILKLLAKIRNR